MKSKRAHSPSASTTAETESQQLQGRVIRVGRTRQLCSLPSSTNEAEPKVETVHYINYQQCES